MKLLEKIGLGITAAYLLGLIALVLWRWDKFQTMDPNAWGDFIAGTFGPLALTWLVLGFFLQSRELRNSVEALQLQTKELQATVEQQRRLTEVTEAQHKLELASREQEIGEKREKETPLIRLTGFGSSGGRTIQNAFIIRNRGGYALSVSIEVSPNIGPLSPNELPELETDDERKLTLVTEKSLRQYENVSLKITSQGMNSLFRVQKFELRAGAFAEISSEILDQLSAQKT